MVWTINTKLEVGQVWKDSRGEIWTVSKFWNGVAVLISKANPRMSRECTLSGGFFSSMPAGLQTLYRK